MSSGMGSVFRVVTFGESHGPGIGCVVDGCPPRLPLDQERIQAALDRRRPGGGPLVSARNETDRVAILAGIEDGLSLGSPIALWIGNRDARPADYEAWRNIPRPSHADATVLAKYGIRPRSGGGRASARETAARVAAGAVAEAFLRERHGIEIVAWTSAVGPVEAPDLPAEAFDRARVDEHPVRCPVPEWADRMRAEIESARDAGDSVGGVVSCVCRNLPAGWGEPVFDKLDALLARAMLSIPAAQGFDLGSGFAGARLRGSRNNDPFVFRDGRLRTASNRSGGVQGGISNGEPVVFRVAFKPPPTIGRPQRTVDFQGRPATLEASGRHDPCVAPRAVPVVEAMAAIVLADCALVQDSRGGGKREPELPGSS